MAAYACEWQAQTDVVDALWLPGVGDHGGGPTRDMLEMARRFDDSSLPQLEFTTAEKYLQQISTNNQIPTWNDELYLEFHRGCYTTHGDQKRWNRKSENLLYQAELFAALASITCGVAYPKLELETAWKQVLFNQFHDILPGSSITQVYTDALPQWEAVAKVGQEILEKSLIALASHTTLPTPPHENAVPVFVFNPLNWERSEVVAIDLPQSWENACIYDLAGILPSQLSESGKVLFLASKIPSVGDRVFWICPQPKNGHSIAQYDDSKTGLRKQEHFALERLTLENEFLRVTIDEKTGDLSSVFDKVNHKEILRGNGNQLQAFRDSGQYWDAWNIDPNYAQHPLAATQLKSIDWVEQGIVRNCIRVVRVLGESEFCSDYILDVNSPILKIATTVNWQERHVLVKAAFPLNVESDFATYEIPCGVIKRPTKPETAAEKAKWEVPALHWADITAASGGVSLLNDCKYGYDSQPNQLRLTLLRGSTWPDPEADKGFHEFTYALYPHSESWESAGTVRRGYELNIPLQIISQQNPTASGKPADNLGRSLINLSADNLILMAFKQAEDNPQQWILRCYECHGAMVAHLDLQGIGLTLTEPVDLLERPLSVPVSSEQQSFTIQPWKIRSFKGQV
jgi:alpha-mannosidase